MHKCPFRGCTRMVKTEYFACGPHWHSLRKDLQNKVYSAWDSYLQGRSGIVALLRIQDEIMTAHNGGAVLDDFQDRIR